MIGMLLVPLVICGAIYVLFKGVTYMDGDDVPPWRKFNVVCPVCQKVAACWKRNADRRIEEGFGVLNMYAPKCKRCDADLAEPYMRNRYVAALVAEAMRAVQFKATAVEYNAAVEAARKVSAA